jgi:speckle-type POZ protein
LCSAIDRSLQGRVSGAADRYAIERLKIICQSIIGKNLDVDNVSTTLALADQHHCDRLSRDSCFEFITSSPKSLDAVKATHQGYANLKKTCVI